MDWVNGNGYEGGRIIYSNTNPILLASSSSGGIDVFSIPQGRGGQRIPQQLLSFRHSDITHLTKILSCLNVTGVPLYDDYRDFCGHCPLCQAWKTETKSYENNRGNINQYRNDLLLLNQLLKEGHSLIVKQRKAVEWLSNTSHWKDAERERRILSKLEKWFGNEKWAKKITEMGIRRLEGLDHKELRDNSKLIQKDHWFLSISIPMLLHILFETHKGWLMDQKWDVSRRTSTTLKKVIRLLRKSNSDKSHTFDRILVELFKLLSVEVVTSLNPSIELTMEYQPHPYGAYDNSPDLHFLICTWGRDVVTGKMVPVQFDRVKLMASFTEAFNQMADFALWAAKRWNKGCREAGFRKWRTEANKGIGRLKSEGIGSKCVDLQTIKPTDLLTTHKYLRKNPTGRIQSLFLDRDKGVVTVRYFEKDGKAGRRQIPARFGIVEFLGRLIGQDGRSTRIEYTGAYKSKIGTKRSQQASKVYDEFEADLAMKIDALRRRLRKKSDVSQK